MNLYEKLAKIQASMRVPKDLYSDFGKYYYRNAETIMNAFKPLGSEYNAVLFVQDEVVAVDGWHYIKATAVLADLESDAQITASAYAREESTKKGMDASQISGTASSYARKYALNGLFLLDDVKDADTDEFKGTVNQATQRSGNNNGARNNTGQAGANCLRQEYIQYLYAELKRTGIGLKRVLATYGCAHVEELTDAQYNDAVKKLAKSPNK